ncbi:MAG: glycine--tRNA ligase subunit beta [Elusimicrobiota bacterium]|nr:glycine--tRNA ligase subunit beta [Endomicrobiia bacterium]MDW8165015.1 glycine--tRNA ligase subunit beta [Elusimicrobiota bacterium]
MTKKDFLIEIYTEELPPSCIKEATQQLGEILSECLKKFRVDYREFGFYITPVRIVVVVKDIKEFTKEEIEEIVGPSVNIGIKNGEFTSAAIGFAKKHNVELKDLFIKETLKGKFLAVKKIHGGESFKSIINDLFVDFITRLKFSKTMVWENTKFSFPRPIRNILVIYDNSFIKIKFSSVVSSNFTFGIKTFPIKKIKIETHKKHSLVDAYFDIMEKECIILDQQKRLEILLKSIEQITARKKLKYDKDEKLLNEITAIVEYPTCILCEFPEEFLSLPKEFIITCMKSKQKFIPLYDESGNITNKFIGVKNGYSEHLKYVKEGFEKVLIARLNDVKYYYEKDKKVDFISYFEKLKNITYNSKLSLSYYDKIINIKKLAEFLNDRLGFSVGKDIIDLVSKLIKNDLPTQIVFEYPELQGVAGKIYCEEFCSKNNLPKEIALCCFEHLKPRDFEDDVPSSKIALLFSIAEKFSIIIDNSILDSLPTGSSDPLGIKKIADGLIKISIKNGLDFDFKEIISMYCSILGVKYEDSLFSRTNNFFIQRFESILLQNNFEVDEIRSILINFKGDFYTKWLIISILKNFRHSEEFYKLIELYKRVNNILNQAKSKGFKIEGLSEESLFKTTFEYDFYKNLLNLKEEVENLWMDRKYEAIIKKFIEFKPKVDEFFDKVLVFDKETDVALNRLKMLYLLLNIFNKIGYLNYIQT